MDSSQLGAIVNAIKEPAARGVNPRKMQQEEIEQLIQAAALIGNGRARGGTDEQIIGEFARKLIRERDRRVGGVSDAGAAAEALLKAEGLAADTSDLKSQAEILRDEAEFGFGDEKLARIALDGKPDQKVDELRAEIRAARKMRAGKQRNALLKQLGGRLANREERAKINDAKAGEIQERRVVDWDDPEILREFDQNPLDPTLERLVRERGEGIEGGREINMRRQEFYGDPGGGGFLDGPNGPVQAGLRGRRGIELGEMVPIPRGLDRERGGFVRIGAERVPVQGPLLEGQEKMYIHDGGERRWRERGQLFAHPDDPKNIERRLADMGDPLLRQRVVRGYRGELGEYAADKQRKQLAAQDRAMGGDAVKRFLRQERGELNTAEMQEIARREAARVNPGAREQLIFDKDFIGPAQAIKRAHAPGHFLARPLIAHRDAAGNLLREEYNDKGKGGLQHPKEKRGVHPGVGQQPFNVDDAQAAVLGQLQARKEANRAGRLDRIRAIQQLDNVDEANRLLRDNALPGPAGVAPLGGERRGKVQLGLGKFDFNGNPLGVVEVPNAGVGGNAQINNLGAVKDKRADMGLQLGNQKTILGDAQRVQRSDGSFEFVDRAGNPLYNPTYKEGQGTNSAQVLNAPDGGQNVIDWIKKNEFEDRGAIFFGEDGILGQMNDKGAGGGIEQVDIGGAIGGFEEKVAKRLGIDPKRVANIKGAQAAINAVIAGERARGNAFVNLVDGEKVVVQNPGVEEAMMALKVPPAEQKQIANALKQRELAVNDQVPIRRDFEGRQRLDEIFGVNDPKRGGDRLDIAKDVKFQGKIANAVDNLSPEAKQRFFENINEAGGRDMDAGRPFVGQVGKPKAPGFERVMLNDDGSPMDAIDVRNKIGERNRQNREKLVARKAKQGKKQIFGPADDRRDVAKIRAMQEGNIFAQIRADRAAAGQSGGFVEPRGGVKRVIPGLKRRGEQELLPRPVRPNQINSNPTVTEEGGLGNVSVPEGFKSQADRRRDRRRIAIGGGISAAVLGTLLGLGNMNREEEEQMV